MELGIPGMIYREHGRRGLVLRSVIGEELVLVISVVQRREVAYLTGLASLVAVQTVDYRGRARFREEFWYLRAQNRRRELQRPSRVLRSQDQRLQGAIELLMMLHGGMLRLPDKSGLLILLIALLVLLLKLLGIPYVTHGIALDAGVQLHLRHGLDSVSTIMHNHSD